MCFSIVLHLYESFSHKISHANTCIHADKHTHPCTLIYTHRHAHKHTHTHTHTCTHAHTYSLSHTHTHCHMHTHCLSLSLSLTHTNTHTMYCTQGHHQFLRRELFNFFNFFMTVLFSSDFSKTQCKSCMPCEAGHYGNKTGLVNCTMCWRGKKDIFVPAFGTLVPDTDNIKYTDS